MIIIEGPNGCGKSKLIGRLVTDLGCPGYKLRTPRSTVDVLANVETLRHLSNRMILDRHPAISDRIYGPIMFGAVTAPWPVAWHAEHMVIYCRIPIGEAIKRHKYTTHDPFYGNETRIFAEYDATMNLVPHLRYDWTRDLYPALLAEIKREYKCQG